MSLIFGISLFCLGVLGPFLLEPSIGLAVFAAFTHITPQQLGIEQFRAPLLVALATLLSYLGSSKYKNKFSNFPIEMKLLIVMLLGMFIGSYMAFDKSLAFYHFFIYLKYVIFFILLINVLDNLKKLTIFYNFMILSAAWLVYKCWDLRGTTGARFENMGGGIVADSNHFAAALIMLMPLVFMRILRKSNPLIRFSAFIGMFGIVMSILITVSRGAFLGLSALVITFIVIFKQYRKQAILFTIIMTLSVSPFIPGHYVDRISTIFSSSEEVRGYSASSRLQFWNTSIDVWKKTPLYGCGLRNFIYYNGYENEGKEWGEKGHVAHSIWFEALAEGGVLVFLPLVTLLILFFWRTSQAKKKFYYDEEVYADISALQIGMIGFLVCATFLNRLIYEPIYWWCGIAYVYHKVIITNNPAEAKL